MRCIEIVKLVKVINKKKILNAINLNIKPYEVCGLIGPNGAGKTTLINCVVGLVNANEGLIKINDIVLKSSTRSKLLRDIGTVLQYPSSISRLSINQIYDDHIHYLSCENANSLDSVLTMVGLKLSPDCIIGKLSLGMKQRLLLGLAISHKPKLLILDEPFNGLDPDGISLIKDIIENFKNHGGCILIASHSLKELEDCCTNIAFIEDGRIFENKNMKDIRNEYECGLNGYYKQLKKETNYEK
ncbi:MAG: ABC transporter ATP-binding protein [Oscillospiraceae bacterium]|nr:ABC transporter ATP-binding protein [Oscillospiraceae bacterium]